MTSSLASMLESGTVAVAIGGLTVNIRSTEPAFLQLVEARYGAFAARRTDQVRPDPSDVGEFDVEVIPAGTTVSADEDLTVRRDGRLWRLDRGDFSAEWDPVSRRGRNLPRPSRNCSRTDDSRRCTPQSANHFRRHGRTA